MATRDEMLAEAHRRGILPTEMSLVYEEANRRGLFAASADGSPVSMPEQSFYDDSARRLDDSIQMLLDETDTAPRTPSFNARLGLSEGIPGKPLEWDDPNNLFAKTEKEKLIGTGRGYVDAWEGAKQIVLRLGEKLGFVNPEDRKNWEAAVEQEREEFERDLGDSTAATIGRVVGGALPYAVLPGPGVGAGTVTKIGYGAATGGAVGASQYVPEDESRIDNAAFGAAAGAGGAAVLEGISRVASKVVNAVRGKVADPQADELLKLSEKHDVPLSLGDVIGGPVAPKAETATEYLPVVGMGRFRQIQHDRAKAAAQRFMESQKAASDDWAAITQGSLKEQSEKVRLKSSQLYDRLAKVADDLGEVPTPRMNEAAKEIISAELEKQPAYQDAALIKALGKYAQEPKANFTGVRAIRSDLGDEIADHYRGANGIVGAKGARHLQAIKNALEEDLESFSTTNGNRLKLLWNSADKYYRNQVVPFKDKALARAANTDTPDEIYRAFIQRGKADRARKFYTALGVEGRQAIRFKMVEEAYTAASKAEHFSPATFARKMEDIQAATGVFFKGPQKAELDGLTKLMRHAQRAGQYMENPPTGQRVIPYLAAGAFAVRPGEAATVAASAYVIKKLTTTRAGKGFLLAASKAEPGSKQMAVIVNQLEKQWPKLAAAEAYNAKSSSSEETTSPANRAMPQ